MQFDELSASLRGDLLTPDSSEYDDTRAVYNAMIDKKPSAIAMCVDAADVQTRVLKGAREMHMDFRPASAVGRRA